jgi:Rieske Fe-S protein
MDQLSRRRVLSGTGAVAAAVSLGACSEPSGQPLARSKSDSAAGAPGTPSDAPPTPLAAVRDLSAEPTETVDPGTGNPAFLVKGPDGVSMLSAICSHMGCTVAWHAGADAFVCPCHGAIYDSSGTVVGGPAPAPLDTIPVVVRGGQVFVR